MHNNIKKGEGYEQMIHRKNTNEKNIRKADQPFWCNKERKNKQIIFWIIKLAKIKKW